MEKFAFALPQLPGKEACPVSAHGHAGMDAYRAWRKRAGIAIGAGLPDALAARGHFVHDGDACSSM
jgi:hypothetical protein